MRYKFTGEGPEIYPTIVIADVDDNGDVIEGSYHTLECEPGGTYDLPDGVSLPRLEPDDDDAKAFAAAEAERVEAMEAEMVEAGELPEKPKKPTRKRPAKTATKED